MASYNLQIQLDSASVKKINQNNQRLVISKVVNGRVSDVAWVSFDPFENNKIMWTNDYILYASTSEKQNGALIDKSSITNPVASANVAYTFEDGVFDQVAGNPGANTYRATNQSGKDLTLGLGQNVQVNGKQFEWAPISAEMVFSGETYTVTPKETLVIALVKDTETSQIISRIDSVGLKVEFSGTTTEQTVHFVPSNSTFAFGPLV